jgi:hypothetical protein
VRNLSDKRIRLELAPVVAVSFLVICGGRIAGQTMTEEANGEGGTNTESIRAYVVTNPGPQLERWTPAMELPSAAEMMILSTAERLVLQAGTSPAGPQPNRSSAGGKVAAVAEGVITGVASVITGVAIMADVLRDFHESFCPFCRP